MSNFSLAANKVATIPIRALDQHGNLIGVPVGLVSSTSDEAIVTVEVGADGASVILTPHGVGTADVAVSVGSLSATLTVDVTAVEVPVATTLVFDTDNAVLTDLPAPSPVTPVIDPNASSSG